MIKIPLSDIISRIKEKTNLSDEDINNKIEAKLKQLSGLISHEGAAHIIANELGVKLFEIASGRLQIKNILVGMRDVEVVGKVMQVNELREFKTDNRDGKVASFVIGDETGEIRTVMWGSQAENIKNLAEDMIVKIKGGYVRDNALGKEVHLNERSKLILNPKGESVGEIKGKPAAVKRKSIKDLQEKDNAELLGTIVQIFEPRFFEVCPQCNKRLRQHEEKFICELHNEVKPNYSCVLNLFLDDGTENIRTVFFRSQAERLLGMSFDEILKYKNEPEKFDDIKTKLLGNLIKVVGRANKNQMFDRIEFITNMVFLNPDPDEEIKRLEEERLKNP